MPVQKYRSVADMPRVEPAEPHQLVARIRAVWRRAQLVCPASPPRGVRRFASIEAANDARMTETLARMRRTSSSPR
jgi:DNA-binding response OmpR family regulator